MLIHYIVAFSQVLVTLRTQNKGRVPDKKLLESGSFLHIFGDCRLKTMVAIMMPKFVALLKKKINQLTGCEKEN